ncbi:MAG: GGDEF domain-containing protein [Actinomycetia bacterium]|nr:GGDEF domain-containing protein [Actinomycetes bacterium]
MIITVFPIGTSGGTDIVPTTAEFDEQLLVDAYNTPDFYLALLIGIVVLVIALLLTILLLIMRENRRIQKSLYTQANDDAVTGLPNRRFFFTYLDESAKTLEEQRGLLAVLFLDIDNFKAVNDQAGHDVGDTLLKLIGQLLDEMLAQTAKEKNTDCLTARLGGDEFVQLLPISSHQDAQTYIERLYLAFKERLELQEYIENHRIGLSIGMAVAPEQAADYHDLIRMADIAMYHAKMQGKNSYAVYDPSMNRNTGRTVRSPGCERHPDSRNMGDGGSDRRCPKA